MQKVFASALALVTLSVSAQASADSKTIVNFAFGGAQSGNTNLTVLFDAPEPGQPSFAAGAAAKSLVIPGLSQQLDWFEETVQHANKKDLFWLWIGTNDFLGAALTSPTLAPDMNVVAGNVYGALSRMADRGAEYIVLPNLVPTGKIPLLSFVGLPPEVLPVLDQITAAYNYQVLPGVLAQFSADYPDVTVIPVDIASVTEDLLATSGLITSVPCQLAVPADVGAAGCAPFFFVDTVHPTETVYAAWADAAAAAIRAAVPDQKCKGHERFDRIIVLGDSFSDKGSFDYTWNTSVVPPREPFLPDTFFPLDRFSDGLNVIDFLEMTDFVEGETRMVRDANEPYLQQQKKKKRK